MTAAIARIKPVEWEVLRNEDGDKWQVFRSVFGSIDVFHDEDGCRWRWCFDEYYDEGQHECESVEEGKRLAEEFYMSRLEPAIEKIDLRDTAKALAACVLAGDMNALAPLMDRLQETTAAS